MVEPISWIIPLPSASSMKSSGGLYAIVAFLLLAVLGGAFYWLRLRGH